MSNELCLVYVTTKDAEQAKNISYHLLKKKLIACSNVIPNMTSNYFWNGKLENSNECILLLKTTNNLFDKLESEIENLHSYDCPCIFSIPIKNCGKKYKQWLLSQLGEPND